MRLSGSPHSGLKASRSRAIHDSNLMSSSFGTGSKRTARYRLSPLSHLKDKSNEIKSPSELSKRNRIHRTKSQKRYSQESKSIASD